MKMLLPLLMLLVGLLLFGCNGENQSPPPNLASATPTPHKTGELFAVGSADYIVSDVHQYYSSVSSKYGLAFSVYIKNNGMVSKTVICNDMKMIDSQNRQFDVIGAGIGQVFYDTVQPGMDVTLHCFSAMPQNATGLRLDLDTTRPQRVYVEIGDAPPFPTATPSNCSGWTSCSECTARMFVCKWCRDDNKCYEYGSGNCDIWVYSPSTFCD